MFFDHFIKMRHFSYNTISGVRNSEKYTHSIYFENIKSSLSRDNSKRGLIKFSIGIFVFIRSFLKFRWKAFQAPISNYRIFNLCIWDNLRLFFVSVLSVCWRTSENNYWNLSDQRFPIKDFLSKISTHIGSVEKSHKIPCARL